MRVYVCVWTLEIDLNIIESAIDDEKKLSNAGMQKRLNFYSSKIILMRISRIFDLCQKKNHYQSSSVSSHYDVSGV